MFEDSKEEMKYEQARAFAVAIHYGQVDKGGRPYIEHCVRVADQMDTDTEKVVAVLHDTLEDTGMNRWYWSEFLEKLLTVKQFNALWNLTRVTGGITYAEHLLTIKEDPLARKVKIADLRDNLDPVRAKNIPESLRRRYEKALDFLTKQD